MQITRLRLSGFKSFVEPSELRIEPGLTGIVGPNGCGKSNLLEAIRWVMGENAPKAMRSGGMEDVIFAGTSSRPARNFAEVTLNAVQHEGRSSKGGPINESDANRTSSATVSAFTVKELEITRRIERGAGSAYRLNGDDVRAKDIALIFADAATGAHSPALVSQGKIAALISAKPQQRRILLEEAAGITGLHVRRRDAEAKLRQTENNLTRLDDLMSGLETQIASLKRQARQAERYNRLSEQIQLSEAKLLFAKWRDAAGAADTAREESTKAEAQLASAQSAAQSAESAQRESASVMAKARDMLDDDRHNLSTHAHHLSGLTSKLEAAKQRLEDLHRQQNRYADDRAGAEQQRQQASEKLAQLEQQIAEARRAEKSEAEELRRLIAAKANAESAAQQSELALANAAAALAGVEADWRIAEAELDQLRKRRARCDAEQASIAQQLAAIAQADDPASRAEQAKRDAASAAQELAALRKRIDSLTSDKREATEQREDCAARLAAAKAELAGVQREYEALEQDRSNRETAQSQQGSEPFALDIVRAEPGYERALAAVLDRGANAVMRAPQGDQQGFFWAGSVASAGKSSATATPSPDPDSLLAHIPEAPDELKARLAKVQVADQDDGRALAPGEWLVTRTGRLRRWDGFIMYGTASAEAARLEADNRFAALAKMLPKKERSAHALAETYEKNEAELASLQAQLDEAEQAFSKASERERAMLRESDKLEAAAERRAQESATAHNRQAELSAEAKQCDAELSAAEAALAALPSPEKQRETLVSAQEKNDNAREQLMRAGAALSALEQAIAVAAERQRGHKSEIANWRARAAEAEQRLADMAQRKDELSEEIAVLSAKPQALSDEIAQQEVIGERLMAELERSEAALRNAEAEAQAAQEQLKNVHEALASAREQRAACQARLENGESRRQDLASASGEAFACPPPLLPERMGFTEKDIAGTENEAEHLANLKAQRERIGPVNLVAGQELERLDSERSTAIGDREELAQAVTQLRASIGRLNHEGRERLQRAFTEVDAHFQRLFAQLFSGGKAHLALIDSEDPLEAGVEIYAQPPGKALQSLSLLSGGEQALTAIALTFALFLTNPAPICVLDEVDAPLDDANTERFCALLEAMARETETRYLIVTHNALTMSRMHRLFGVTMIEQGVSRLVSVNLDMAEELVAAE